VRTIKQKTAEAIGIDFRSLFLLKFFHQKNAHSPIFYDFGFYLVLLHKRRFDTVFANDCSMPVRVRSNFMIDKIHVIPVFYA